MRCVLCPSLILLILVPVAGGGEVPRSVVARVKNLRSVARGAGDKVYVAVAEPGKEGSGAVLVIEKGKALPFAGGLDEPAGMASFAEVLFVADRSRVWKIDRTGKAVVHAAAEAFPVRPRALTGLTIDELGRVYVSDAGDGRGGGAAVYRIEQTGKVSLVCNTKSTPDLEAPRSILLDGFSFLLVLDASGRLLRVSVADGKAVKLADSLGTGGALAWDWFGRLYVSDAGGGQVRVIGRPGDRPVVLAAGFQSPGGLALGKGSKTILVADTAAGTLTILPATVPGQEVDDRPLPLETEVAFPNLKWTGWKGEDDKGLVVPLRPVLLTHAGDGSNRVFVGTERGVIHVFPNDQQATKTRVFLDLQDRVVYDDNQNEEGFLGLAFHPRFKENGEFFVYYTRRKPKLTNVLSRFRVRKDDPDRADPASEEELMRFSKPFWNHNGGTLCFGPDGFLYIAVGDGGSANDPYDNGQDLGKLFGKVLRIDVDHKDGGRPYAIPRDNPFVGKAKARPEIWAYGLRNPWRMAFDRKTGKLWAGDVGQNLWEEIDILTAGGNYGWNRREGLHPFGAKGSGPRRDLIDPIWEYHHDLGKSITGGHVYRGKRLPELEGAYLYADYVSTRIWALRYDEARGRVVSNRPIRDPNVPIMSFGEDEMGEVYFMTYTPSGQGIYRFTRPKGEEKGRAGAGGK